MDILTTFVNLEASNDFLKGLFAGIFFALTCITLPLFAVLRKYDKAKIAELTNELQETKNEREAFRKELIKQQNFDFIGNIFKDDK